MQNASHRIAQERRSPLNPTPDPFFSLPVLDPSRTPYDAAAAEAFDQWRPGLKGDPRTCDTLHLYASLVCQLGDRSAVAEIGVAWCRGVIFLASLLVAQGSKRARVYAVDPWRGPGDPTIGFSSMHFQQAMQSLVMNTAPYELDIVHPVRVPSPDAASAFPAGRFDLVFIDGCHTEAAVRADVYAWTRTVRAGGVLAGHDYTDEFPGVKAAVNEAFGGKVRTRGTCWLVMM